MDYAKVGSFIYTLRREKKMTQKKLGEVLHISDKTISKWERGLGCPDVSLLAPLSEVLGVNIEEMLAGHLSANEFVGGNMKKSNYYICSSCGNLTVSTGDAVISCCGRKLSPLESKSADEDHRLIMEEVEDQWYITADHEMTKEHYVSFVLFVHGNEVQLIKAYPEWNLQLRLPKRRHGFLYWYCTEHGLFRKTI